MTTPKKQGDKLTDGATAVIDPAQQGGADQAPAPTAAQAQATQPATQKPAEPSKDDQIAAAMKLLHESGHVVVKGADSEGAAVEQAKAFLAERGLRVVDASPDDDLGDVDYVIPAEFKGKPGVEILMDACDIYGFNPDPDHVPVELLAWKHYPADRARGIDEHVVLVSAGGAKFKHFKDGVIDEQRDPETAAQIRNRMGLWRVDPATRQLTPVPIPDDLTMPEEVATGQTIRTDHVYTGGYLRSGGKTEAARRASVRAQRSIPTTQVEPIRRRRR